MDSINLILIVFALLTIFTLIRFADQKGSFEAPNPGIGFTWIINILIKILATLFPQISQELRISLERFLLDFYSNALRTDNPWDDFLARFLLRIFSIPLPPEP